MGHFLHLVLLAPMSIGIGAEVANRHLRSDESHEETGAPASQKKLM